jgi:hypothetical protein
MVRENHVTGLGSPDSAAEMFRLPKAFALQVLSKHF